MIHLQVEVQKTDFSFEIVELENWASRHLITLYTLIMEQ